MLAQRGHQVRSLFRHSDELRESPTMGLLVGAVSTPWNVRTASRVKKLVRRFRPDVVHVHNTFPLLSPSVFYAVGNSAATVLTLHNYRILCPAAIPLRNDEVCHECIINRSVRPALRHRCYRASFSATAPLAANVALHRALGTWRTKVDAFIALSDFQKKLVSEGGVPEDRIHVRPNFVERSGLPLKISRRSDQVLYVGRLTREKGVHTLIDAWKKLEGAVPELLIVGDGPCKQDLTKQAKGLPIRFLGQVTRDLVASIMSESKLLVVPSEWHETFGLVVIEAMSLGTPAIVSNLGALPEIVDDGVNGMIFPSGDSASLSKKVRVAMGNMDSLQAMSDNAVTSYNAKYNPEAGYASLLDVYKRAITVNERSS